MAGLHTDEELKEAEKQGVGLAAVGMKEDGTLVGIFEFMESGSDIIM